MQSKVHSFSYLMELIIVIFFFTISTTICVSLIVKAKEKQTDAKHLQDTLLNVQSMIETMQAYPQKNPEELFVLTKINEHTYQGDSFVLKIYSDKTKHGEIQIYQGETCVEEFPFVLGGIHNE